MKYNFNTPILLASLASLKVSQKNTLKKINEIGLLNKYSDDVYNNYLELWEKYGHDYPNSHVKKFHYYKKTNSFKFVVNNIEEDDEEVRTQVSWLYNFDYSKDRMLLTKKEYKNARGEIFSILNDKGIELLNSDYDYLVKEYYQKEINSILNQYIENMYSTVKKLIKKYSDNKNYLSSEFNIINNKEKNKTISLVNEIIDKKNKELKEK